MMAERQGITLGETSLVNFVDLRNGHQRACRYEPPFFTNDLSPLNTENRGRGHGSVCTGGVSWGLRQLMGLTAREAGLSSLHWSTLCGPAVGLVIGCKAHWKKLDMCGGKRPRHCWRGMAAKNGLEMFVDRSISAAAREENSAEQNPLQISSPEPEVSLPAEILMPQYDSAVDYVACQAWLEAAQFDLKYEQAKTVALGRERDSALQTARGGSVAQIVRAAKWFAIGAAAGSGSDEISDVRFRRSKPKRCTAYRAAKGRSVAAVYPGRRRDESRRT